MVVGTWPRVRGLGFRFITDRKLRHFLLSLAITLVPPSPPPADVVNIAVNLNNYSCLLHTQVRVASFAKVNGELID